MNKRTRSKPTKDAFISAVGSSQSITEVIITLGYKVTTARFTQMHFLAKGFAVTLPNHSDYPRTRARSPKMSDDSFFVVDSVRGGREIRQRLRRRGVPYICSIDTCNVKEQWNGKAITLQVDHIDGDRFNNTIENLRFICPNCHSQTETFGKRNVSPSARYDLCNCGRTKTFSMAVCPYCSSSQFPVRTITPDMVICQCGSKKDAAAKQCLACDRNMRKSDQSARYPDKDVLLDKLVKTSFVSVAKEIGVSDSAVRKYVVGLGIDPKSVLEMRKESRLGLVSSLD